MAAAKPGAKTNLLAKADPEDNPEAPLTMAELAQARSSNLAEMVLGAAELVIQCRQTLVWTYAWAFLERDAAERELFEYSQKDLEIYTEKLSSMTEKRSLRALFDAHNEISTLCSALKGFLEGMENYKRQRGERDVPDDPDKAGLETFTESGQGAVRASD